MRGLDPATHNQPSMPGTPHLTTTPNYPFAKRRLHSCTQMHNSSAFYPDDLPRGGYIAPSFTAYTGVSDRRGTVLASAGTDQSSHHCVPCQTFEKSDEYVESPLVLANMVKQRGVAP